MFVSLTTFTTTSAPVEFYKRCDLEKRGGKSALFIIDPQNDFCEGGSLPVPGAAADCERIAQLVDLYGFDHIYVSLDQHEPMHVGNAAFWKVKGKDEAPAIYTTVTLGAKGEFMGGGEELEPALNVGNKEGLNMMMTKYVKALQKDGKFELTLWPTHCRAGGFGANIVFPLERALDAWSMRTKKTYGLVMKGNNACTECYSALHAEVPDKKDPRTLLNTAIIAELDLFDEVFFCGEALSHCLNWTVRDYVDHKKNPKQKVYVIRNCTSPVMGELAEEETDKFLKYCKEKGVQKVFADGTGGLTDTLLPVGNINNEQYARQQKGRNDLFSYQLTGQEHRELAETLAAETKRVFDARSAAE